MSFFLRFVGVFPKGRNVTDHYLSVYLGVANPQTLRLGWKRKASFFFILFNQSGKELGRSPGKKTILNTFYYACVCVICLIFFKINISVFGLTEVCRLFCAYTKNFGRSKEVPLKKLKEKGSLENNKLIVKVEIKVHEVVDEGGMTGKEMVDIKGFRVLHSQVFIYLLHGCFFFNSLF